MGYVGLPLMLSIAESGFKVEGIDLDDKKVDSINNGRTYIDYIVDEQISSLVEIERLSARNNYDGIEDADIIIICVPTPITVNKDPDLTYINSAVNEIAKRVRNGHVVILESTTYPGTTEEIILPALCESDMVVGKDFFLGFSPERVDPGNKEYSIKDTNKVVSGITEKCADIIECFYSEFVYNVHRVSSPKVAEISKLFENTFRNVNIALVNELSLMCNKMAIDVWEVIEAAASKPFGFMPFYPGPGLGGHCIPIDPLYLVWKAKEYDFSFSLVEISDHINCKMPSVIIDRLKDILNDLGKPLKGTKVLLIGISYKKDVSDVRESPALRIIKELKEKHCDIVYNDPYIKEIEICGHTYLSSELTEDLLMDSACTVILSPHSIYDYEWIAKHANAVFDTRNATDKLDIYRERIIRL
jgi:UDP-N-acetyl-D-glucosamine dehydrogenase